ncbi:hypothetical protein [Archangium sp.]|uniref:hypothetical protein n=1 Tax=Archangium sp. TaxID=1872627 RepID=UPI0038998ECF
MQTKQKWALTLMMALGAVSCGGSSEPGDAYQGFIDATVLDAKFQPGTGCGSGGKDKCYLPVKSLINGEDFSFYNLGLVAPTDKLLVKDALSRPALPYGVVKTLSYDFPEGCKTGKTFDERTDSYHEDMQYPVFDGLPLTSTTTTVLPLVNLQPWTGVSKYTCNAIKDAQSLKDGDFGGTSGEQSLALRAVIDMTYLPARPSAQAGYGWYRGLQLAYLDGGAVPVSEDGNVKMMDGVWLKPTTSGAKPTDATAKLVFQAKPGDAAWSPVVRLREISPGSTVYKRLCYDPPCATDAVDMTKTPTYSGVLFLVSSPQ